jgi:hypothetical protein
MFESTVIINAIDTNNSPLKLLADKINSIPKIFRKNTKIAERKFPNRFIKIKTNQFNSVPFNFRNR